MQDFVVICACEWPLIIISQCTFQVIKSKAEEGYTGDEYSLML